MENDRISGKPPAHRHEEIVPRLTSIFIIAGSVVLMMIICLTAAQIILRHYAQKRPMQPMQSLGILTAPDNQPLTRLPAPNLELDDGHADFVALHQRQMLKLNSYGWIDSSNHIARIPIERAMDLMTSRGLPVETNLQVSGSLQFKTGQEWMPP